MASKSNVIVAPEGVLYEFELNGLQFEIEELFGANSNKKIKPFALLSGTRGKAPRAPY